MNGCGRGQGSLILADSDSDKQIYPRTESTTSLNTTSTIKTTIGLKSKPPKLGRLRRTGPSTGSVTWFTKFIALIRMGCGLPPLNGMRNERMTRAKMAIVNSINIALISPATLYILANLVPIELISCRRHPQRSRWLPVHLRLPTHATPRR